jgi:hypothetical protein
MFMRGFCIVWVLTAWIALTMPSTAQAGPINGGFTGYYAFGKWTVDGTRNGSG